jgi:myo-inositol-1(or 4)-monophosphatase
MREHCLPERAIRPRMPPMQVCRSQTVAAIAAVQAGLAVAAARVDAERRVAKDGVDFATGADIAAEEAIRRVLNERCPGIEIVGEEGGGEPPGDGRPYWLVDPICGTLNYAANLSLYCTNVALVESGIVTIGVVGDGGTADVDFAERGRGAFRDAEPGSPLHRLLVRDGSVLCIDLSGKPAPALQAARFGRIVAELGADPRFQMRMLGTTLVFPRLAAGDVAGMLFLGEVPHELHSAAGCLLAEEAGARITDLRGEPWTLATRDFAGAATPKLHAELLELVKRCT